MIVFIIFSLDSFDRNLGFGKFHIKVFKIFNDDAQNEQVAKSFLIRRYDMPRCPRGTAVGDCILVGSQIVIPTRPLSIIRFAYLAVTGSVFV